MKVMYTSDLHGIRSLYAELLKILSIEKPDVLILGGDLLPNEGSLKKSISIQQKYIERDFKINLVTIKRMLPSIEVYLIMGNDDWSANIRFLDILEEEDLCTQIHMKKCDIGEGYELIGYSCIPPTPFINKDWERRDLKEDNVLESKSNVYVSTEEGLKVLSLQVFFYSNPSIEEELMKLPSPKDFRKTIYVMHSPPFNTNCDLLYNRLKVGSKAIRNFIERYQPLLTLHGHIHESPKVSGYWWDRIGSTLVINPGHDGIDLHAVLFELKEFKINIWHTVYGKI